MAPIIERPVIEAKAAPRFVKPSVKADYGDALEGQAASTYMPGDHVVLLSEQGEPNLYHINSIDGNGQAVCERVDGDLNPTGDLLQRALPEDSGLGLQPSHFAALQPLYLSNAGGADDYSVKAVTLSADAPDSAFAYAPKGGNKSDRKLPLTKNDGKTLDPGHIKLAWQAVTKGIMGQKASVGGAVDGVKKKIRAAANALPDGDVKKAVLAYISGKSSSDSAKAEPVPATPEAEPEPVPATPEPAAVAAPEPEVKAGEPEPTDAPEPVANEQAAAPVNARERNIAAKSLSDDGWRIGGYLVLFGDKALPDVTGDWFTKGTDFMLDSYGDKRPLLYDHTLDKDIGPTTVGTIDKLEADDYGVWMEAQINRANRYASRVREIVKSGKAGLSSGSLAHVVRRKNDAPRGEITVWPLGEGSVTVTPAEPRTLVVPIKHYADTAHLSTAYKSIGVLADWLQDAEPQEATAHPNQESSDGSDVGKANGASQATNDGVATKTVIPNEELVNEQEMATIAKLVAEQLSAKGTAQAAATPADEPKPDAKATKALPPSSPLPAPAQPEAKSAPRPAVNARVIGDRRFADYTAQDMSFLMDMYAGILDQTARNQVERGRRNYEYRPLERAAKAFYDDWQNDPDRRMQRLVSDKVLRGIAEKELDPNLVEYIPFRDKAAVEGNLYDPTAEQYAREERLAAKMFDQGKTGREITDAIKALQTEVKSQELDNTGQSSFGAEWVPTIWNSDAWRRVRINNPVAGLITNVQMPSSPWNWPIESTDPTVFFVGEGTDASMLVLGASNQLALSKAGTGKVSFTAKKLGSHIGFSVEENEDSIIPIIPIWRFQLTRALWNFVDDTIINGDTTTSASTNINLIDSTPAAGTSYLAFDGMRKYCLITNTGQLVDFSTVAPTMANLRKMQTNLAVQYQADFQNLAYVTNVGTYQKMKSMPEFSAYLNVGVMPPQVTGLLPNGSPMQTTIGQVNPAAAPVGVIDGIPLYVSAQINLAKSGAIGSNGGEISNTPANNITGSILLFHRSRCVLGWRRAITTDVLATSVFSDTFQLWGTCRIAFNTFDTTSIALGYDIAN